MWSDDEDAHDFSPFSTITQVELEPESGVGKELLDRFEALDDSFRGKNERRSAMLKLIGLTAMCATGVVDLEREVVELRRELRSPNATRPDSAHARLVADETPWHDSTASQVIAHPRASHSKQCVCTR
jgi:hypothetical protein